MHDDESVRESLPDLLRLFGFDTQTFRSAEALRDVAFWRVRGRVRVTLRQGEEVVLDLFEKSDGSGVFRVGHRYFAGPVAAAVRQAAQESKAR